MMEVLPGILLCYALVNAWIFVETMDEIVWHYILKTAQAFWNVGSAAGKLIVFLCTTFVVLAMLPCILLNSLIDPVQNLYEFVTERIMTALFPKLKTMRIEVPLQSQEVLKNLRDNECCFSIGKDCISFDCMYDFNAAREYLVYSEDEVKYVT